MRMRSLLIWAWIAAIYASLLFLRLDGPILFYSPIVLETAEEESFYLLALNRRLRAGDRVYQSIAEADMTGESSQEPYTCTSKYKGRSPTTQELSYVLSEHKAWLQTHGKQGKQANLCDAILTARDLREAELSDSVLVNVDFAGADLRGANFSKAKLNRSNLSNAMLQGSILRNAEAMNADFSGANLDGADLMLSILTQSKFIRSRGWEAKLSGARLQKTNFEGAFFSHAKFAFTNLIGASFKDASLQLVDLSHVVAAGCNFEGVDLLSANLERAVLNASNFSNANFMNANLREVWLYEATLTGARFEKAKLTSVVYEPFPHKLPVLHTFIDADQLDRMTYVSSPNALKALRDAFRKEGMDQQARMITFALKHRENGILRDQASPDERKKYEHLSQEYDFIDSVGWQLQYWTNFVLFEFTSNWGMNYKRPLLLIWYSILLFGVPFGFFAYREKGKSLIFKEMERDRIEVGKRELVSSPSLSLVRECRVPFAWGLYFSFLSAFRFGWRDLTVATWLSRIQPNEYTMRATGWLRFLSGVESLICLYLLALWALVTYAYPFEE